jgi:Tfp pilus assembly protein PilF
LCVFLSALLRRGTAYKGLKKLQKAKTDIENVLEIEPNNKKAQVTFKCIITEKKVLNS